MKTLSKNQSEQIKGLAIILMIVHHLFRFPSRIPNGCSVHFLSDSLAVEYQLAVFGKVCVVLFLFVSGYGLGTRSGIFSLTNWLRRIGSFYILFLINFTLLIGISWLWFHNSSSESGWWKGFDWSPKTFIGNLLLLNPNYSMEWGFARIYVILIGVAWPTCEVLCRYGAYPLTLLTLLLYGTSGYLDGFDHILSVQAAFVIGFVLSRWPENGFHQFLTALSDCGRATRFTTSLALLVFSFLMRKRTNEQTDWIVGLCVAGSVVLWSALCPLLGNFLAFFGKHSASMWLNHSFVFYYWYNRSFYAMHQSVLLFLVATACSLAMALLVDPVIRIIQKITFSKPKILFS